MVDFFKSSQDNAIADLAIHIMRREELGNVGTLNFSDLGLMMVNKDLLKLVMTAIILGMSLHREYGELSEWLLSDFPASPAYASGMAEWAKIAEDYRFMK